MRQTATILGVVLLLAAAVTRAGEPTETSAASEAREKMKALEFLVGEWEGEAWVQMGPGPREIVLQQERVGWEVDGEVLLIRGRGVQVDADTGKERVGHLALAAVAWDADRRAYVMWSYARGRGTGQREMEVRDGGFEWVQSVPGGEARYTMHLDEEGRWVEAGEFSRDDGGTWYPFLGMTLTRR